MTTLTLTATPVPVRRRESARPASRRASRTVHGCAGDQARGGPRFVPAASTARVAAPRVLPPARLTTRGRVALVVTFMASIAVGLTVGQASVAAPTAPPTYASVTVQPGQTLWEIAIERAPGVDPRRTVARLVALNGLADADAITAGDRLNVPVED